MKYLLAPLFLITTALSAQVDFSFESAQRLPSEINSKFEETAPVFDNVHDRLYFTRTLHPENTGGATAGQDIWMSERKNGQWGAPTNEFPSLNNKLNNSVIGISADGSALYLQSTYEKKLNLQQGFSATAQPDGTWADPEKLEVSSLNIKGDIYSGYVNRAGDIMIISMNSRGSYGEEDLYISFLEGDEWSKPLWMGDSINSAGFEISPFLMSDNLTLVFASNGHGGYGDCDIFYVHRKDSSWTNWTKPINMGPVVNSEKFDAFGFPYEEHFYFSSNKGDTFSNIYVATNESYFSPADTVRLVFRQHVTTANHVTVDVFDENGKNVGKFNSYDKDVVAVHGLKQRRTYRMKASHPDVDLSMFTPEIINAQGIRIQMLHREEDGMLVIAPDSPEKVASMDPLPNPEFDRGMGGVFELDRVPVRSVMLALNDENGKTLQYARTDDQGRFAFAETEDSLNLVVKVLTQLEYLKQNGIIYFTDEDGTKLFKAGSVSAGIYKYQKLQAQEMAKLKMLKEMDDTKMQDSKGVFKYKDLPKEGVKLYLVDANDNIIEEVITDANGRFEFSKLNADRSYQIKVADEMDTELKSDGLIYFMDAQGNELNILNAGQSGEGFQYRPLRTELITSLRRMQEEDASAMSNNYVFSIGLFKYKSLPKEGIVLRLLDENDNVVEEVTTDENGQFVFSMLKADQTYKVQVVGMDEQNLKETELYFVSKNGKVITAYTVDGTAMYTFTELDPDYFFSIQQVNERETELKITESFDDVTGQYRYRNLPKEGVKLYLLDENDKIIETVYTDKDGNFRFSKLAKESNFYVRVSEEDAGLLDASSFVMKNEEEEYLEQEQVEEDGFQFRTLPRANQKLASLEEEDGSMDMGKYGDDDSTSDIKPSGLADPAPNMSGKNDLRLYTTYFHFNSVRLSDRDRFHINQEVWTKVASSSQPILIVGYSCDIGTQEEMANVAQLRAEEIKKYLITLGVDESRIETSAVIDGLEGIEHPTTDQRVEQRKAEVYHLTP